MKQAILKIILPAFMALAGGLVTKVATVEVLNPTEQQELKADADATADKAANLAAGLCALGAAWLQRKYFPNLNTGSATSGGNVALLMFGTAAVSMVGLSSCQNFNPASALPPGTSVTAFYGTKTGTTVGFTIGNNQTPPPKVDVTLPTATKPETAVLLTTTPAAEKMPATLPVVPAK